MSDCCDWRRQAKCLRFQVIGDGLLRHLLTMRVSDSALVLPGKPLVEAGYP
jgi:hypothetical protein